MKPRIMYIELKTGHEDNGPAWIGRVTFSKTGQTLFYRGMSLQRRGDAASPDYEDVVTGERYWAAGVKQRRGGRQWTYSALVEIDEDVRQEYERLVGHPL